MYRATQGRDKPRSEPATGGVVARWNSFKGLGTWTANPFAKLTPVLDDMNDLLRSVSRRGIGVLFGDIAQQPTGFVHFGPGFVRFELTLKCFDLTPQLGCRHLVRSFLRQSEESLPKSGDLCWRRSDNSRSGGVGDNLGITRRLGIQPSSGTDGNDCDDGNEE
jgi:hypothetical protein